MCSTRSAKKIIRLHLTTQLNTMYMSRHLCQPIHLGTQPMTTMGMDREPTMYDMKE